MSSKFVTRAARFGQLMRNRPLTGYRGVHLSFDNRLGSVEHYFHFLLGFLVPLLKVWPDVGADDTPVLIRSCALMDRHLAALDLPLLKVLDRDLHRILGKTDGIPGVFARNLSRIRLSGYDLPTYYDAEAFAVARARLPVHLARQVEIARRDVEALFRDGPRVVVIDRLPAEAYFLSARSEGKGSGTLRRSVPNMAELAEAIRLDLGAAHLVTLEHSNLAFQFALFQAAEVVIAQHGAALANLIWCEPGTSVVEILAEERRTDPALIDYFGQLSHCLGLSYHPVWQADNHAPVPVTDLRPVVAALRSQRAVARRAMD